MTTLELKLNFQTENEYSETLRWFILLLWSKREM
jgi:hypothetical protein